MKTTAQVQQDIDKLIASINGPKSKKELSKIKNQVIGLRQIKLYLMNNPNPEFIAKQLDFINKKITEYKKRHLALEGMHRDNRKIALKALNKEYEITKLRKQKKALEYLIGEGEAIA